MGPSSIGGDLRGGGKCSQSILGLKWGGKGVPGAILGAEMGEEGSVARFWG